MTEPRQPKGYRGEGHETIGSDVLSVLKVVSFPESVLGESLAKKLQAVQPDGWYPIADLLEAMEKLEQKIGRAGLVQMGRNLFRLSHEERLKAVAKSAADVLFSLNDMYRHANRGNDIGGWRVVQYRPGFARMEKTTPHHCVMEEGILLEALRAVGVPSMVRQPRCFRQGADLCEFEITSVVTDEKWMGGRAVVG